MTEPPAKRRKMRPNNAITMQLAKSKKPAAHREDQENSTRSRSISTPENGKTAQNRNDNVPVSYTRSTRSYVSASDSDETDKEVEKPVPTRVSKTIHAKDQKTKTTTRDSQRNQSAHTSASDSDKPVKEEPSSKKRQPIVQPMSDSDSNESDKEELPTVQSKSVETDSEKVTKSEQQSNASSDSDSDDTDTDQHASKPEKKHQSQKTNDNSSSVSDSDETDTEHEKRRKQPSTNNKERVSSASDSDETDTERKQPSENHSKQSSSSSDESSSKKASFRNLAKTKDHLVANRISFRRKHENDPAVPAARKFRNRLVDDFVPKVDNEDFISDSDSETDSGEDYDSREYPLWQRGLGDNRHADTDPWPKPRKFGYSDKLRLEKRIKKICKRENITFEQAQEIFSSSRRKEHLRFFQKIGKAFPDMSLHMLAKHCKDMYHIKRNNSPWTQEEIDKLDELKSTLGSNTRILSQHLNRSPKNINDFLYSRKNATKKLNKPWTEEEDKVLAKAAAKIRTKQGARMSFLSIEPLFKGERSQRQIYARYYLIRHRIRPDGTLEDKRKATPYEELEYLKKLMAQVDQHNLIEESQLDFAKDRGYVYPQFYLNNRANIQGFEKMKIKDILQKLIQRQNKVIQSRKEEGLLGSDQAS